MSIHCVAGYRDDRCILAMLRCVRLIALCCAVLCCAMLALCDRTHEKKSAQNKIGKTENSKNISRKKHLEDKFGKNSEEHHSKDKFGNVKTTMKQK